MRTISKLIFLLALNILSCSNSTFGQAENKSLNKKYANSNSYFTYIKENFDANSYLDITCNNFDSICNSPKLSLKNYESIFVICIESDSARKINSKLPKSTRLIELHGNIQFKKRSIASCKKILGFSYTNVFTISPFNILDALLPVSKSLESISIVSLDTFKLNTKKFPEYKSLKIFELSCNHFNNTDFSILKKSNIVSFSLSALNIEEIDTSILTWHKLKYISIGNLRLNENNLTIIKQLVDKPIIDFDFGFINDDSLFNSENLIANVIQIFTLSKEKKMKISIESSNQELKLSLIEKLYKKQSEIYNKKIVISNMLPDGNYLTLSNY